MPIFRAPLPLSFGNGHCVSWFLLTGNALTVINVPLLMEIFDHTLRPLHKATL